MVVAKRKGREKPEQRKIRGLGVEQTAFLAIPIYIGQAQGEEKTHKKRSQRAGGLPPPPSTALFSLSLLGRHALTPRGCIFIF